jgi:imidazolonepropionase-like amidohydrolase
MASLNEGPSSTDSGIHVPNHDGFFDIYRNGSMRRIPLPIILMLLGSPLTYSQTTAVQAKRIYTVTQGIIDNGTILIQDGKIRAVGNDVRVPSDAQVHRAEEVIPGMIDAHTHLALDRSSRPPGPVTAEWKAVDHVDLESPMLQVALSGGVTSIITRPGSGIVCSGQSVALKLKRRPEVLKPYVDLKMAVRPLVNLRPGQTPATVMGWYATASEYFRKAQIYEKRQNKNDTDERLEAFAAALRGDVMVHVHAHYPSEISMALELARKFGFLDRLSFAHASEAYPMAEVLAETSVIPVVGPVMIDRFYGDIRSHNVVKELMEAGVAVSLQTDQSREHNGDFREYGAFLVRHGLSEEHALRALTLNGAKAMMLEDRLGSIEAGKEADLVLLDGHLFDLTADRVSKVIVDGSVEYERERDLQPEAPTPVGPFTPMRGNLTADDTHFAIVNAHIFTVSRGIIPKGTVVVEDGKITAVREGGDVPRDLLKLDVGGRVLLPGWVTARAHPNDWIGDIKWQVQNDEVIAPVMPEMNARFAVDPWFPSFPVLRGIGITAQNITPGHTNLAGGSGVVIKTAGMDVEKMVRKEPSCLVLSLAEASVRHWGRDSKIPVTLESASRLIRDVLDGARRYHEAGGAPSYHQRFEALLPALKKEVPVIIHAKSEEEIKEAMAIASDYGLRLVISGGTQAHRLAEELSRANVGVILGDTASRLEDIRGGGDGFHREAPAILAEAGVKVSFFGPSASRRGMPSGRLGGEPALNAAWVFRNGASEQKALEMFTLNAADMLGMEPRIGSIEVGKDADFQILEGHPFDYRVLPTMVFIDGRLAHQGPI